MSHKKYLQRKLSLAAALRITVVSSDFEGRIVSAFKLQFPSAKPLLCQFHFQQRMKKTIQEISGKYKKIPPLVYIKNLTRAIFFMPWSKYPFLIDVFFRHILSKKDDLDESLHANFDRWTNYLYSNYFGDPDYFKSYSNSDCNTLTLHEYEKDLTNNGSETVNRTFNSNCTNGKKNIP